MLSILLPVYKCSCVALVTELQRQCMDCGIAYEIIVADDGTMADTMNQYIVECNKVIGQLEGVRYIIRQENVGRSAIRNFLFSQSKGDCILFIDGDLSLDNPDFIRRYTQAEGDVVVGGIRIGGNPEQWKGNLRYKYECVCKANNTIEKRQKQPFQHLATNILIRRRALGECPYDERINRYGYEDVLLGKRFQQQGLTINHIDNPVLFCNFESNETYISKTEEALHTLLQFRKDLINFSSLLKMVEIIHHFHLTKLLFLAFKLLHKPLKHRLESNKPSIFLFNLYKLMYYISLEQQAR